MNYTHEIEKMCTVAKGCDHGPAPIPEEGRWVKAYEIKDISGLSHGVGWCAPVSYTHLAFFVLAIAVAAINLIG